MLEEYGRHILSETDRQRLYRLQYLRSEWKVFRMLLLDGKLLNKEKIRVILGEDPDISGLYPLDQNQELQFKDSIPLTSKPDLSGWQAWSIASEIGTHAESFYQIDNWSFHLFGEAQTKKVQRASEMSIMHDWYVADEWLSTGRFNNSSWTSIEEGWFRFDFIQNYFNWRKQLRRNIQR